MSTPDWAQGLDTQFRALFEAAPDAMVLIDRAGRIKHVNGQVEALFDYHRQELLGELVEVLIPERFRGAHPAVRGHYFDQPRTRAMGAGGVELFGRRKDGAEFPVEVSLSPLDMGGDGPLVIAAIRDGTARKRVEDDLRRLLAAAPDAMVIAQGDGEISFVNVRAEALFGYTREEMLGRSVEMLIPERYRSAHPRHREGYFDAPQSRPMGEGHLSLFGRRKNGDEFPAEISLSPLSTAHGVVAITAIRDITERKKVDEQRASLANAQEALRMRDEFLSIASHELRTPLSALKMQVDSMLRLAKGAPENRLPERLARKVDSIDRAVTRLTTLVGQLLDVSRITAGKQNLELEQVDLGRLARTIVEQFEDKTEPTGSELRLQIEEGVIGQWDALRVEQVITNLLSNALKYGLGKPISVSITRTPDAAGRITVTDHGIGIEVEAQARIFQRFERASSSRNYGGLGLGLWIARQIVDAHGGNIHVWSQPGAGAVFTVDLPRTPPRAAGEPAPVPAERCVMLVDDDAMIRDTFVECIQDAGHRVVTAVDGYDALEQLRGGARPSVIFLDLTMPRMDGPSFRAAQLRDRRLAAIPVVIVSAASDLQQAAEALHASVCLRKPLQLDQVIELIERFNAADGGPVAVPGDRPPQL